MSLSCNLSFDACDPYFPVPGGAGVTWAVQVFTTVNGYGLDPEACEIESEGEDRLTLRAGAYARLGQQLRGLPGRAEVRVRREGGRWIFDITADSAERVKSVKLTLRGLPTASMDAGWWSPTSATGSTATGALEWNYPGPAWATPWASAGDVVLSMRAPDVSGCVLHVASPAVGAATEVEIVHAVPAGRWSQHAVVPPVRLLLGATATQVEDDLQEHLAHVETTYGLTPFDERPDVPGWARDVALVVTLHGQHWTGHVFNTFEQSRRILQTVSEEFDGRQVLAYLPGWEGRYYYAYPHYRPGEDLGGEAGFAGLAQCARELGIRLMPMFGANGANVTQYPRWQQAAIRNPSDRYPTMLNAPDWDGDRQSEGDQVFLNPGEPVFRAYLVEAISALADDFGVDAAFLDTAGFWFDDPRFPIHQGYRDLARDVRARHPELLLVSEGWWDALLAVFPMAQQWLGVPREIARPELLTRYARTTGHLAEGTPGGSTGVHEQGYRARPADRRVAGHVPVIGFAGGSYDEQRMLLRSLGRSSSAGVRAQ